MYIIYITCAFLFNATTNILFKLGAKKGIVFNGISLNTITDNMLFLVGLVFFGLSGIFYFMALNTLPLSITYPIMVGMSIIIINIFAFIYLGEQITMMQVVGYTLLILGMVIIFSFSAHK